MKTAIVFATLLLASTLLAEGTHVYPLAPTTATPVEVHYLSSCRARTHSVVRNGNEITITAREPRCPGGTPVPIVEKVKLPGLLPAGEYDLTVVQEHEPFFLAGTEFVVRNAGPKPFELHPSAVYAGDELPIRMSGVACETGDCSDITVRVDGQPVGPLTVAGDGGIWFTAPAHEEGLVDVTVQKADFVTISPGALYFFSDPFMGRNYGVYEPVLFPVLESTNGAHGSEWRSEATVSNPAPWTVYADYKLSGLGPCIQDCDPPIEPKSLNTYHQGYPRGTVFWAPRSEAAHLAFSLRIRDVSRQAEGYGTQVPVVRERDFIHGANIHLLDVPLDPRYRVKVRIYMVDPVLSSQLTGSVRIPRGDALLELPFAFPQSLNGRGNKPYYAEVDLPQGVIGERVKIEIAMPVDAIGWAFASITNNETQQVTIVAPM